MAENSRFAVIKYFSGSYTPPPPPPPPPPLLYLVTELKFGNGTDKTEVIRVAIGNLLNVDRIESINI